MALSPLQRDICRVIAQNRREGGESYVAGGAALNVVVDSSRISRDVDLFHDTAEALRETWHADRRLLETSGFEVEVVREETVFIEARIHKGDRRTTFQWVRDSAYRFFPLVAHEEFGMVLHPFDLATNKVLASVGRLETKDWIDVITCHDRIQRFGYLAWAASGKDPGFSPRAIVEFSGRSNRFTQAEIDKLEFEGSKPEAAALSRAWHAMRNEAAEIIELLPCEESGKCVIDKAGRLFAGNIEELAAAVNSDALRYHEGAVRGALPHPLN